MFPHRTLPSSPSLLLIVVLLTISFVVLADNPSAEPVTADPASDTYAIRGYIDLLPRWAEQSDPKPAAYTVLLDVSGSANLNFRGWGWYSGQPYQCEVKDPAYPTIPYSYDVLPFSGSGDCTGAPPKAPWIPLEERRTYAARDSILNIAEGMRDEERLRVVAFDSGLPSQPAGTPDKWYDTYDPGLRDYVLKYGEECHGAPSPCYLTGGGTNGAMALNRARELMDAGVATFPTDPNTGEELRRVLIYLTDGVSNRNDGYSVGINPACAALPRYEYIHNASCHIGYEGEQARPITQMAEISRDLHETLAQNGIDDFALYVVMAGRGDTTGLDHVATNPDMLYRADDPGELEGFMNLIQNQVSFETCVLRQDVRDQFIDAYQRPNPILTGDPDIFGYLNISHSGMVLANVPIRHIADGSGGQRLGFELSAANGLPPGEYQITDVAVYYKPVGTRSCDAMPDYDGTELYTRLFVDGAEQSSFSITLTEETVSGDTYDVSADLLLDMVEERNASLCDDFPCDPVQTPEPESTATPTATPTATSTPESTATPTATSTATSTPGGTITPSDQIYMPLVLR